MSEQAVNIQLMADNILVQVSNDNNMTKSGLYTVTDTEPTNVGTVSHVGPGLVDEDGNPIVIMRTQVGNTVMFANDFLVIEHDGHKFLAMRQDNIIGIVS